MPPSLHWLSSDSKWVTQISILNWVKLALLLMSSNTCENFLSVFLWPDSKMALCIVCGMWLMSLTHAHSPLLFSTHSSICWMKTNVNSLDQTRECFFLHVLLHCIHQHLHTRTIRNICAIQYYNIAILWIVLYVCLSQGSWWTAPCYL